MTPSGHTVTLLLFSEQSAEEGWKMTSSGNTELLLAGQPAFADGDSATLQKLGSNSFAMRLVPGDGFLLKLVSPGPPITKRWDNMYLAAAPLKGPSTLDLTPQLTKPAESPPPHPADFKPSNRPRVVAAAPTDADFARAATYTIPLPKSALTDTPTQQHFLRITYTGDVARLTIPVSGKDHLLTDNFADGRPWLVGLTRFAPLLTKDPTLKLSIYPLRPNPPIFFESGHEPKPDAPTAIQSVELLTQYTLKLKLVPTEKH